MISLDGMLSLFVVLGLVIGFIVSCKDNPELFKKPFNFKHILIILGFLISAGAFSIQKYIDYENKKKLVRLITPEQKILFLTELKKTNPSAKITIVYKSNEQESKEYAESFLTLFKKANWKAFLKEDLELNQQGLVLYYPRESSGNQNDVIWQAFSKAKINNTTDVDLISTDFHLYIGNSAL